MKTKLLKKIRKRYKYYFRKNKGVEGAALVTIDEKEKKAKEWDNVQHFLKNYINDHIGINTYVDYEIKLSKRKKGVAYRQALQELSLINQ